MRSLNSSSIHTKCSNSKNISLNGIHITSYAFISSLLWSESKTYLFYIEAERKKWTNNNIVSIALKFQHFIELHTSVCGIYCGIHKRCEEYKKRTHTNTLNCSIRQWEMHTIIKHCTVCEKEKWRTHRAPSSQYIIHIMTVSFIISCAFNFESITTHTNTHSKCTRDPKRKGIELMNSIGI